MNNPPYYLLKTAIATKETGNIYPAVDKPAVYDHHGPASMLKISYQCFPKFNPDIRFQLVENARLTDMLSQATIKAYGFLISEKLKQLFQSFNIAPHRFYNATIHTNDRNHSYHWMQFVWNEGIFEIDFRKTRFTVSEFGTRIEPIRIGSYEELLEKQQQFGLEKRIYSPRLVMKPPPYDLWPVPINNSFFISEQLRASLHLFNATGIIIEHNNTVQFA